MGPIRAARSFVVVGTPETVSEHPTSHTGRYLKQVLKQHQPEVVAV